MRRDSDTAIGPNYALRQQGSRVPRTIVATTAGPSPRSAPLTPFRDIFSPQSMHSREGRLAALVKDFADKVHTPFRRQLDSIAAKVRRTKFLSPADRDFLTQVAERNLRFMVNAESILQSAVSERTAMDRCSVQRCHEHWDIANATCILIEEILDKYDPDRVKQVPRPKKKPQLFEPLSLHDIAAPPKRSFHAADGRAPSPVQPPPLVAHLSTKQFITAEEAQDAQNAYIREYGNREGKAQFLLWLASLPAESLRALQSQLPASF